MNFFVFERKVVHLDWAIQQRVEIWDRNRNQVMMPSTLVHWSSYPRPQKQKRALQGQVYSIKVEAEKGLKVMGEEPGENSGAISRSNRPWVAPQVSQLWDQRVSMSSPQAHGQPHPPLLPTESQVCVWKEKAGTHGLPKFSFLPVHIIIYSSSKGMQFCESIFSKVCHSTLSFYKYPEIEYSCSLNYIPIWYTSDI